MTDCTLLLKTLLYIQAIAKDQFTFCNLFHTGGGKYDAGK